jgi:hypothetical protein|tara:strand:- start:1141 stop:1380 length:240 start_codon:yes stop_codon:yes gene_type:complete
MGMKIQAINTGDLNVEVDKPYYVESDELTGVFKVTHLEVIAAPTASGVEIRAEVEVENPITESCKYYDMSIDYILEDAR